MDGYVLKRMLRRPWLCLVSFFVSGTLCLLLCLLTAYRDRQQAHLEDVRDSYELLAVVTDLRGTKSDHLSLSRRYTDFLQDEENGLGGYVRELRLTKSFQLSAPFGKGQMIGVTDEGCAAALDPRQGGVWYATVPDFFQSTDWICLVSEEVYAVYAEQQVLCRVTDPYALGDGTEEIPFRVVGWYRGAGKDAYIPYPLSQQLAGHLAEAASTDSASFLLKDNGRLEEMLSVAYRLFRRVDPSSRENGFALTVHDRQFKATVAAMEQNVRRTAYLLPLITLLGLGAGFFLGLLATRGELRTYALMRTLGLGRLRLFCTAMTEQLLLPLLATVLVALWLARPLLAAIFLLCHTAGSALSTVRPALAPPTKLLRDQE